MSDDACEAGDYHKSAAADYLASCLRGKAQP